MTARNDITGDVIATGTTTDSYREGWDRIFGKKAKKPQDVPPWVGCGECDVSFECYNGADRCIRLCEPHEPTA